MIDGLARRYGRTPWEIAGSRVRGVPAWIRRYQSVLELSAGQPAAGPLPDTPPEDLGLGELSFAMEGG